MGTFIVILLLLAFFCAHILFEHKMPRRPPAVEIVEVEEENDMLYQYTFALPAPGAKDVVKRQMHVTIDDRVEIVDLDPNLAEYSLVLEEDALVQIYLVDVDDTGNVSPTGEVLEFQVVDMVPPPAPGKVVISDVVEVAESAPEPEPEPVVEPTTPEPVVEPAEEPEPVVEPTEEPKAEEPVAEPVAEPVVEPAKEEKVEEPKTE